jgi:uncharacterized protein (TIGR03382 family)
MKIRISMLLGGCCAPLILAAPASAAFTGLSTENRTNEFGITVVSLYANFNEKDDQLISISGTPVSPLNISVIDGTFFQHAFGSDRAPLGAIVAGSPSLAYDTFVTIGVELFGPTGQSEDLSFTLPTWPGFGPSSLTTVSSGWVALPGSAQAYPFNPDFAAGDGRTLIAQLATLDGIGFEGSMLIQSISGGLPGMTYASFTHVVPTPGTLMLLGLAGLAIRRRRR